jgi:hypothetical protein
VSAATSRIGYAGGNVQMGYRIPSLGYRILVGALRLIPWVILLVGVPAGILAFASGYGVSLPVSILTVTAFGFTLAILGTVRYILKPTRLYGPISMAASGVAIAYLYILYLASPYRLSVPNTPATIGIGFGELVLLLMIVPALGLAAAMVTTYEDLRHPTERLPFDYPA